MSSPDTPPTGRRLLVLGLGALGIVYGDIGTSPLYAMRECFHGEHGVAPTPANVLGVLSLIFWSLVLVISVKYLALVMRADNRGEGGILALMALGRSRVPWRWIVTLGLFGAALLYGDGVITPAISVLSAVEGVEVATPALRGLVVPITIAVLIGLFAIQKRGTSGIGTLFGPVTLAWFATLAGLGLASIARAPHVLAAVNPVHAGRFLVHEGLQAFYVIGAVFLVVTGGEALYADMGHFGRRPIRLAWFALVLPALLANYFGQGALLLRSPAAASSPFYALVPAWGLYPMVVLATAATVIASQAIISGAFSLTRQAIQLGYCPRLTIEHTSSEEIGQIYIPQVNWLLMIGTIGLVLGFRSSSNLAAAYGLAVSIEMVITAFLLLVVAVKVWNWPRPLAVGVIATIAAVDLMFLGANSLKIAHGGWFPLAVGVLGFAVMSTWHAGRIRLVRRLGDRMLPLDLFLQDLAQNPPVRVPGTAVFMVGNPEGTPVTLLHNLKHNKVLHRQVVLATVINEEIPRVARGDRIQVEALAEGFYRMTVHYGFMEDPDVPGVLRQAKDSGLQVDLADTTYFLGRETLILTPRGPRTWGESLFAFLSRNAVPATAFFRLPPGRVVELGVQVQL